MACKPSPSAAVVGSTPALYRAYNQVICQKPCGFASRIHRFHAGTLTSHHTRANTLESIMWLLYICLPSMFTVIITPIVPTANPNHDGRDNISRWVGPRCRQIKIFWKRPRPAGSSLAGEVRSVCCYGHRHDPLISSIGQHHQLWCCWVGGLNI